METKNVVISKEYLDRIRKFAAIKPDETFVYVPHAFRGMPEDVRPRFTLRPISGEEALRYSDAMRGEVAIEKGVSTVKVRRGEFTVSVVRSGLLSWETYYDVNGSIVPYVSGAIDNLPVALLEELCDAILERSRLTQEEVLGLR